MLRRILLARLRRGQSFISSPYGNGWYECPATEDSPDAMRRFAEEQNALNLPYEYRVDVTARPYTGGYDPRTGHYHVVVDYSRFERADTVQFIRWHDDYTYWSNVRVL